MIRSLDSGEKSGNLYGWKIGLSFGIIYGPTVIKKRDYI